MYKKGMAHNPLKNIDWVGQFLAVHGHDEVVILAEPGKVLSVHSQITGDEMAAGGQNDELVITHRKGVPVYERNPSIPVQGDIGRNRRRQIGDERKGFVINDGTGEVLGHGTAIACEWEEVDAERFVKLFLSGLKQASGLSKSGLMIFEVVYNQVRRNPNRDEVKLSFYTASKHIPGLAERTYRRGLRELLDREFLFRSPEDGLFFVNIRYMFNGDRLAFVKAYHLKGASPEPRRLPLPPE
jgi:hypothetical protein